MSRPPDKIYLSPILGMTDEANIEKDNELLYAIDKASELEVDLSSQNLILSESDKEEAVTKKPEILSDRINSIEKDIV